MLKFDFSKKDLAIQGNLFIADILYSRQRILFSGTDEILVKLSQQNLYVADTLQGTPLYGGHHFEVLIGFFPYNGPPYSGEAKILVK